MNRIYKFSTKTNWKTPKTKKEKASYAKKSSKNWQVVEYSHFETFIDNLSWHIQQGHPIAPVFHNNERSAKNFVESHIFPIDLDDLSRWNISMLAQIPFIGENSAIMYPSPTSSLQKPKTRIIFVCDKPIYDIDIYNQLYHSLLFHLDKQFNIVGDWNVTGANFYFGSDKNGAIKQYSQLPIQLIQDWGYSSTQINILRSHRLTEAKTYKSLELQYQSSFVPLSAKQVLELAESEYIQKPQDISTGINNKITDTNYSKWEEGLKNLENEIISVLRITIKNDGFSPPFCSPFRSDEHPSAVWNSNNCTLHDFGTDETYMAKEVAEALNIDWRIYLISDDKKNSTKNHTSQHRGLSNDARQKLFEFANSSNKNKDSQNLLQALLILEALYNLGIDNYTIFKRREITELLTPLGFSKGTINKALAAKYKTQPIFPKVKELNSNKLDKIWGRTGCCIYREGAALKKSPDSDKNNAISNNLICECCPLKDTQASALQHSSDKTLYNSSKGGATYYLPSPSQICQLVGLNKLGFGEKLAISDLLTSKNMRVAIIREIIRRKPSDYALNYFATIVDIRWDTAKIYLYNDINGIVIKENFQIQIISKENIHTIINSTWGSFLVNHHKENINLKLDSVQTALERGDRLYLFKNVKNHYSIDRDRELKQLPAEVIKYDWASEVEHYERMEGYL